MGKYQAQHLLDTLKSGEIAARNDAIKKIIKEKINDEQVIAALKAVIENDSSMSVRNFARAALDVLGIEHSEVEQSTIEIQTESLKIANTNNPVIEEKETMLQTEDAVKIGIVIGIIPTILVILFFFLIGGGLWGLQFVMVFCTPIGIPGGIAGALVGKSLKGSRDIVIIGSILGTILGIIAWLFSYELLGAPFGYIG